MGEKRIDKYVFLLNDQIGEGSYGKVFKFNLFLGVQGKG